MPMSSMSKICYLGYYVMVPIRRMHFFESRRCFHCYERKQRDRRDDQHYLFEAILLWAKLFDMTCTDTFVHLLASTACVIQFTI